MREGVFEVRAVLGPSVVVSDKDIEDSLWHYYYDTDKTVNYLLRMHAEVSLDVPALMFVEQQAPSQSRKTAKKNKDFTNGESKGESRLSIRSYHQPRTKCAAYSSRPETVNIYLAHVVPGTYVRRGLSTPLSRPILGLESPAGTTLLWTQFYGALLRRCSLARYTSRAAG